MGADLSDSATSTMDRPPSVAYPLTRSVLLTGMSWLLWALVLAIDLYWLVVAAAGDWRPWAGLALSATGIWFAHRWRPLTQQGLLVWDGSEWWWDAGGPPSRGQVSVRLDLQSGLLVHFVPDAGVAHWLWLAQSSRPAHWLAMRRALHASGGPDGVSPPASDQRIVQP